MTGTIAPCKTPRLRSGTMNKLNLILHAGAHKVERNEIEMVKTPDSTNTWTPIPHHSLINKVEGYLKRSSFEVVAEAHGLTRDGQRYFGMLQVIDGEKHGEGDYGLVVGIRNSHDKSFPAALALGAGVFVCD